MFLPGVSRRNATDRTGLEAPGRRRRVAPTARWTESTGARPVAARCAPRVRFAHPAVLASPHRVERFLGFAEKCTAGGVAASRPAPSIPTQDCPVHGASAPSQHGAKRPWDAESGGTERGRGLGVARTTQAPQGCSAARGAQRVPAPRARGGFQQPVTVAVECLVTTPIDRKAHPVYRPDGLRQRRRR
jgi:hypothetical protein